jgi:nicotinamide-nucleotide amidase
MNAALARRAGKLLEEAKARRLTLATAESCTAGTLAMLLADAPGAAASFHGGFVAYTKENKTASLGVPAALIDAHTAVSRQVAEAMARGGIARSPADIAVAITGVAGPEPDEDGNPVGLVHLAAACRDGRISHIERRFGEGSRDKNRALALEAALGLLEVMIRGTQGAEIDQGGVAFKVAVTGLSNRSAAELADVRGRALVIHEGGDNYSDQPENGAKMPTIA